MAHYYWIKINDWDDWEPALRVEIQGEVEWYITGAVRSFEPAVIGPAWSLRPMPSPLFITAREFVCYATECYWNNNTSNRAKFLARKIQLRLTPLPDRAWQYVDRIAEMLPDHRDWERPPWDTFEALLNSFVAYVEPLIEKEN
ncbi:MAG: hypothetical protein HC888_05290 [Candidatus Competibacteraceae bacterium]|nr:hypothetical protein [Candidatus Competibacteraceae bacterium]